MTLNGQAMRDMQFSCSGRVGPTAGGFYTRTREENAHRTSIGVAEEFPSRARRNCLSCRVSDHVSTLQGQMDAVASAVTQITQNVYVPYLGKQNQSCYTLATDSANSVIGKYPGRANTLKKGAWQRDVDVVASTPQGCRQDRSIQPAPTCNSRFATTCHTSLWSPELFDRRFIGGRSVFEP